MPRARSVLASLALLAFVATTIAPGLALASSDPVRLALTPVGQPGSYFDLTMRPGESRTLAVDVSNFGAAPRAARTYAADVYTIVDGGFGARLRGEPQTGMTRWLDYPTDTFELSKGAGVRRSFRVLVPRDASPGEYITSLVVENDVPLKGDGSVAMDQIVRQAVAVVVTVPGPRLPGLVIGKADQRAVGTRALVVVAVENTGNVRLKPIVTAVLHDAGDAVIGTFTMPMDTFYAHTATTVEFPLGALLQPGTYRIDVTLVDAAHGARAHQPSIAFVVDPPSPATSAPIVDPGTVVGPGGIASPTITATGTAIQSPPVWIFALIAGSAVAAIGITAGVVLRSRRRALAPR